MTDEYAPDDSVPYYPRLVTSFQEPAPRRYQFGLLTFLIVAGLLPPFAGCVAWIVDGRVHIAGLVALLSLVPTITISVTATAYSAFRPSHALVALAVSCAVLLFLAEYCFLTDAYRGTHFMQALDGRKPTDTADVVTLLMLVCGIAYLGGAVLGLGLSISRNA